MRRLPAHAVEPSGVEGQTLQTVGGETTWGDPVVVPPVMVPLTTTLGGEPMLVWDDDDNLVFTEDV